MTVGISRKFEDFHDFQGFWDVFQDFQVLNGHLMGISKVFVGGRSLDYQRLSRNGWKMDLP